MSSWFQFPDVGGTVDLAADHRWPRTALGGVIVRWRLGMATRTNSSRRVGHLTKHPAGNARFVRPFQMGNPLLQLTSDRLLPDDANEYTPVGGPENNLRVHSGYTT